MLLIALMLACGFEQEEFTYPPKPHPDLSGDDTAQGDTGEPDTGDPDTGQDDTSLPTDDTGEPADDTGVITDDTGDDSGDPDPCPEGLVCVDSFPTTVSDDTSTSSTSDFDAYACAPTTDESGPEIIYQVDLPTDGYLATSLSGIPDGVDVDIHILGSLDPDDCMDRGHWDAGALMPAGRYYVVADSWVSDGTVYSGEYTLTLGFTGYADFAADGLDAAVMEDALYAFDVGWMNGDTSSFIYTILDFSMPSTDERLFTVDLSTGDLLRSLLVTHGENSADPDDPAMAVSFSNTNNSHQSSLGMMRTAETYTGSYGDSMRLDGLEPGYNDNVRSRAIVAHPWVGARAEYAAAHGSLALSWGCPAMDDRLAADFIADTEGGTLYFAWYPDGDWSKNSTYLP